MEISSRQYRIGNFVIPFHTGFDFSEFVAAQLSELKPDRLILFTDPQAWQLHGARYERVLCKVGPVSVLSCPIGETNKTLSTIEQLTGAAINGEASRRTILIGVGGGMVGNLTGLAASLLFRGIRFVQIPTTLMAMHDSVTSLKQGVNCNAGKNTLGAFAAPFAVFIDLKFLESLPQAHITAGMAELLKNGLVLGEPYLKAIEHSLRNPPSIAEMNRWAELVQSGISAKIGLLENDPYERGPAMIMEYGHTIGHAIELASAGELNHGQSVAWGMRVAGQVAHQLGHMSDDLFEEHERLIDLLGPLPRPKAGFDANAIWRGIQRDNKRGYLAVADDDSVAMVLLREPGVVVNCDAEHPLTLVPGNEVRLALERLAKD